MFKRRIQKGKINISGDRIYYVRKRTSRMFVKVVLFALLVTVLTFVGGVAWRIHNAINATAEDITKHITSSLGEDSVEYKALMQQGHFTILALGEDDVEGSKRSDTILLVTVELDDKCVKILALPRDTRVNIPGHGAHKLNSAFAFGGPELLKTTIENYIGEPIFYYFIVDYESFPKLVDAFGGVDIDVKKPMRYVDHAGHLNINIAAGNQHMDGVTALHYVRFRKDGLGDVGRVQRQQQFIKALLKKAYSPTLLTRFPMIATETVRMFKTNMPLNLVTALAGFAKDEFKRENIYMSTLYGEAKIVDNLSYWIGDPVSARHFLDATLEDLRTGNSKLGKYGVTIAYNKGYSSAADNSRHEDGNVSLSEDETKQTIKHITVSVAVLNGSGENGIANGVAQRLQKIGVDVIYQGNAKHSDYQHSNVVYPADANAETVTSAKQFAKLLGIPEKLVRSNSQTANVSVILGHDYKRTVEVLEKINKTK